MDWAKHKERHAAFKEKYDVVQKDSWKKVQKLQKEYPYYYEEFVFDGNIKIVCIKEIGQGNPVHMAKFVDEELQAETIVAEHWGPFDEMASDWFQKMVPIQDKIVALEKELGYKNPGFRNECHNKGHGMTQQFTEMCLDCWRNSYETDKEYYKWLLEQRAKKTTD